MNLPEYFSFYKRYEFLYKSKETFFFFIKKDRHTSTQGRGDQFSFNWSRSPAQSAVSLTSTLVLPPHSPSSTSHIPGPKTENVKPIHDTRPPHTLFSHCNSSVHENAQEKSIGDKQKEEKMKTLGVKSRRNTWPRAGTSPGADEASRLCPRTSCCSEQNTLFRTSYITGKYQEPLFQSLAMMPGNVFPQGNTCHLGGDRTSNQV